MHQSQGAGLLEMQRVLDASLAAASRLSRSLFGETPWDAEQVTAFVNRLRTITLATVGPDGEPHAATGNCACLDGTIYFAASRGAAVLGNLRRSPRVAFTVTDEAHGVIGRGTAVLAGRSLEMPELMASLAATTKAGRFVPEGWDGYVYSVDLTRLFAD